MRSAPFHDREPKIGIFHELSDRIGHFGCSVGGPVSNDEALEGECVHQDEDDHKDPPAGGQ